MKSCIVIREEKRCEKRVQVPAPLFSLRVCLVLYFSFFFFLFFFQFLSFLFFSPVEHKHLNTLKVWKFGLTSNKQETIFITVKSEFDYGSWGFASHLAFLSMYTVNCNSEWQLHYFQFLPLPSHKKNVFLMQQRSLLHTDETNSLHQGVSRLSNMFSAHFSCLTAV